MINALDMYNAQHVMSFGRSTVTHALVEGWRYDAPDTMRTLCGKWGGGVESFASGATIEITCKTCRTRLESITAQRNTDELIAASDARMAEASVTVTDMPASPDFSAPGASECYYGCGDKPEAVFVDYVGRTEGVCGNHLERCASELYPIPAAPVADAQTDAESVSDLSATVEMVHKIQEGGTPVAGVIQNVPGLSDVTHYHSPACADVKREMKRFGQKRSDVLWFTVSDVAEILVTEMGDVSSDTTESGSDEWWTEVLYNSTGLVRIMPCLSRLATGRTNNGRIIVSGNGDAFTQVADVPAEFGPINECTECGARLTSEECRTHLHMLPVWQLLCQGESVQSAILDTQAPNGVEFDEVRNMGEWYGITSERNAVKDVQTLINRNPEAFTLYEMPNQDVVVGWSHRSDGEVNSLFYVTLPEREEDAGFVETMIAKEYRLSVIVDERTGATVDLGWIVLDINSAQQNSNSAICEAYGKAHGTGKPRHGWQSIIIVSGSRSL